MPKTRFKRFLSMVLTMCMVLTMMPTMTLPAYAANGKADAVSFDGKDSLDEQYPLLNKDGVKKSGKLSQLDGENYVAHLDTTTGTLTLWNYTGGTITNGGAGGVKDITVMLKGDNVITSGSLVDSTGGGDITITTDGTNNGSLTINNKESTTSIIVGIGTDLSGVHTGPGAITIGDKAKITIDVENTGSGKAHGIFAKQGVTIKDGAELNVKAKSTGASGGHSTSGIFTNQGGITIRTTGKIAIDTTGVGSDSFSIALYGAPQTTLTNVDTMELKWTKSGQNGAAVYKPSEFNASINAENFAVIDESNSKQTITYIKTDLKFTHNSNLNVPAGNGGDTIAQIDVNSGVSGGDGTKTYTKISGPPWLSVSEDGKITGTRPTAGQAATTAKLRVTDSRGAWREIEIAVGAVTGNAPVTNVTLGNAVLYGSKPYLVNGGASDSGELGTGSCTAYLDVSTGTLKLQGYSGSGILITDSNHDRDLIIDLIGDNTITQTGNSHQYGITRKGAIRGNIIVTSSSGGKLTINVTSDNLAAYGIRSHNGSVYASGNITISGNANVTIDVEATNGDSSLASAYGINPRDTFSIIDAASLTVTAKSGNHENSIAHGIYTSGDASEENKVYMNTTGEVSLNTSDNTGTVEKNQPLYAQEGFYLDNVSKLTLKWSGDDEGEPTYPAKEAWNWTASAYRFTSGSKTHTYQSAGNFFTGTIVIKGEPRVGETLKASLIDTNADPGAIISYRWKVADRAATDGPTYNVMPADVGLELKISATTKGKAGTIEGAPVIIQKGFGPEAPTLDFEAPSAPDKSDGKIIGTTNKMEYADNEKFVDAIACGDSAPLVKAGTYYVRVKETFTHEAGAYATVTVPQGELTKLPTPKADFLATSHNGGTLSDVTTAMKYSVDGGSTWLDITATSMEITDVTTTHGVKVYQPGDNTTTSDSDVQTLTVHQYDKPKNIGKTDCTTEANNDGKLTGLSDGLEYKKDDATSWTEVEGTTEITGLTPGTYLVRRMAEDNFLASESVEIVINAYEAVDKNIKSVGAIADINVDNGTELASLGLPTTVGVTLEDDSTQNLAVSWDNGNPTYAKDTAGDYVFTGTLTLVPGITNTTDVKASVKVIVADPPPENYTITVQDDGNGVGSANPTTAVAGTEINLTATANTGYKFKEWQVISGGVTITSNKFTMPDNDVVVKAIFEKMDIPVDKATLTAAITSANTNKGTAVVSTDGTDIDPSDKWVSQTEMDAYTSAITTAQAVADKTDANQTEVDNAATALNTATITFNSAKKAGIKVTIEVTKVTISPKTTEVQKGTTAQFTASVEGTGSYDKTVTWSVYGNNDANTTINSSGILTVDAGETATSLTVTATSNGNNSISDDATVTISDVPVTTYTATIINGSGDGDYPAGATVSITADTPPLGQEFDRWTSSDVTLSNENATTTTFEMPANDVTITAIYKDLPLTEYTVTVQDDGNGIGSAYPSTAVAGTEINLTATADTGYKFKEWQVISGGVTITSNKFTMPEKDVVVKAIFEKEEITPPVTTYTVTINGSYASTTGGGKYAKDTTVTIHAGSRSNYSFNGWTSSDGISFANANSATTSFTMPDKPVTLTANWRYTGGGGNSGGGGGGSTSPTKPTIPTADGTVKVEYSTSNGTASLSISNTKANEIIAKAKNREAVLDLESVKNITGVNIPKNALSSFEKADLDLVVKLPEGTATIDNEALASILDQSTGTADMKIELKEVTTNSLSLVQKESVRKDDLVFDINILMGGKKITEFDGKLTINVPYDGELPVAVWYLNHKGELEKLESRYRNGLVSFTLNHLSLYVVGKDKIEEEIELETKWINPFTDVQENSWFYDAVRYVYENDLMKGTGDNLFSPNEATTRGMIVTILYRLEGLPLAKQRSFADVKADKYYANAVAWAAENKIVNGYGNDKFGPEDPITREQLAAILMNYAKYKGYDVSAKADLGKYEDSKGISNWARDAMSWANAEGLIQGDGNKLIPTGNATRAQVAAILSRFVDKIIK